MNAALFDGAGTMRITEMEKPVAGPSDAIIRVRAAGICGSDLLMNADKTEPDAVPAGHEVAGEIVEVGEGVGPSRIGERVAVATIGHGLACTRCWYCRMGQFRQCLNKAPSEGGGFAVFMKRRAMGCYPLPESLSWEEGALVEPLAVSVHALRRGGMTGGETVAVLGAGNIGLTTVAAARAMGAGKILATARHEQQATLAKRLGADAALPPEGAALREALAEVTDGRGADLTVETVGGKSDATLKQAIDVTRMQGRIVVLGGFHAPITLDWLEPLLKEQSVVFSSCYSVIDGRHDYEIAIDLLASGRVQLEQMVTHRLPLEEIQKGFETAYDKSTGSIKVQIYQ
jgi:threonine dehydrogenase-like Zn-dependent dehydrogenase